MKISITSLKKYRNQHGSTVYTDLLIIFFGILLTVYLANMSYDFGLYLKSISR